MSAAENDPARHDETADPPLTVQLVADLQAGLLDDDTAARVRSQIRTDPQAEGILRALNQVRRDVASTGADPASAPDIPPALAARISAALSSAGPSGIQGCGIRGGTRTNNDHVVHGVINRHADLSNTQSYVYERKRRHCCSRGRCIAFVAA